MTRAALASELGITPRRYADYENRGDEPSASGILTLASCLRVEPGYFYQSSAPPEAESPSFRAMSRMSASTRDAATATAEMAAEFCDWIGQFVEFEAVDLPDDLVGTDPVLAATVLRDRWALGTGPLPNLVQLLELKGVRVLGMRHESRHLDAFSYWTGMQPIVLINARGTAERRRWDLAHELGHLILHRGHHQPTDRGREDEADVFAANFLIPAGRLPGSVQLPVTLRSVRSEKLAWQVSAFAYIRRLQALGYLTEWGYRSLAMDASQAGLRSAENDIPQETSTTLMELSQGLRRHFGGLGTVAKELRVSRELIEQFFMGLTPVTIASNDMEVGESASPKKGQLRMIHGEPE